MTARLTLQREGELAVREGRQVLQNLEPGLAGTRLRAVGSRRGRAHIDVEVLSKRELPGALFTT